MPIDVVRGTIKNIMATSDLVSQISSLQDEYEGTLYLAYPLTATADNPVTLDAMLVTREKGFVAFIFDNGENANDQQDKLYYQITNALNNYESLRKGRELAVPPVVISYYATSDIPENTEYYHYANNESLSKVLSELPSIDPLYYERLAEALQKISTLKPKKRRNNVTKETSKGAIIKKIEEQIANLDQWQRKAAFEVPEGPQRIRGLAGSGKTVVLALKAAYLHAQNPDWEIAVTFYSMALAQQFRDMITNFSKEYIRDEPDWAKLHIIHAWGTFWEEGIYSKAAYAMGITPYTYEAAKSKFGTQNAFAGSCNELISTIGEKKLDIYDAILIDEAQDMPCPFFKMCYKLLKAPKRLVFAYDELQNLGNNSMPSLDEMFGHNTDGSAIVRLENREGEARQDIVLPICYRNTPWALTLAHALGFGIYHRGGIFQLFSETELWDEIGYKVSAGELKKGENVRLVRRENAIPHYFIELLEPQEAVGINRFDNKEEEYAWVADEIKKNIVEDELDPDDIVVIFPNTYTAKSEYTTFRTILSSKGISSVLAGVETDRDTFKVEGCITCAHIYRAKGNEAPMVYVLNADYCAQSTELRKVRNILFTAITRSRAWVHICGVGESMDVICEEARACIDRDFSLDFRLPTDDELKQINLIHRDRTEREIKEMKKASQLAKDLSKMLTEGNLDINDIPEIAKLMNSINRFGEKRGNSEDE